MFVTIAGRPRALVVLSRILKSVRVVYKICCVQSVSRLARSVKTSSAKNVRRSVVVFEKHFLLRTYYMPYVLNPQRECVVFKLIKKLQNILASAEYCFRYGAFVLEDPHHTIFNELRNAKCNSRLRAFGLSSTHSAFRKPSEFAKKASPNRDAVLDTRLARSKQYEIYNDKVFQWCTPNSRQVDAPAMTTLLFYPFAVTDDESERRTYLYLKLERFPWWHGNHITEAFKHYILKTEKTLIENENTRRENNSSKRRKKGEFKDEFEFQFLKRDMHIYLKNIDTRKTESMKQLKDSLLFYEWNVRSAAEFFVPSVLLY